MKSKIVSLLLAVIAFSQLPAQNLPANARINLMLMGGEYGKALDTCRQILVNDSLNSDIHYFMGLAWQNMMEEDSALNCFSAASGLNPDNKSYSFMLAKEYYGKGKFKQAEPILQKLCSADSLSWIYAYYLTGIYMQSYRYDDAIEIYDKFQRADPANTLFLDKLGFAYLKKEDFITSIELYTRALAINSKDLTAIKNLAYLYSVTMNSESAIQLLTTGIETDSSDTDLYLRRAALYYSKHYTKRALDDYMVVLSSGDSSKLYLKRIGIGYCNNLQPREAIDFLLKAYKKDSADYETCSYLGQSYYNLKDMKNSIYYYDRVTDILTPVGVQLGLTYILLGESQKGNGMYQEAVDSYLNAMNLKPDPNLYMITANLYDEKLNDREKAIFYYQKFLDNVKHSKINFTADYIETVKQRLSFLRSKPVKEKQPDIKL
jgi:tetratricopeptide (TPR) repeat protein